jgi:hypothetical protein
VLPVAITTAGALEPEAFVLVYLLAAAFFAEALVHRIRDHHLARTAAEQAPGLVEVRAASPPS